MVKKLILMRTEILTWSAAVNECNHHKLRGFNHTTIRAAFVCLCVCSLSPPRSFDGSSPNLVAVCRWTSHLPLRAGVLFRKGQRVNGSLSLSTILYMRQPHATRCNGAFCFAVCKQQSLILRLLLYCTSTLYVGAPRNCPWGVLFLKGQRVNGSTGQLVKRVTFQWCM